MIISIHCIFANFLISDRDFSRAIGNIINAAKSILKDAITIDVVPSRIAKRMKMDAVETANIAPVIARYGEKDFFGSMSVFIISNYSYISLIDFHFLERYNLNGSSKDDGGKNGI